MHCSSIQQTLKNVQIRDSTLSIVQNKKCSQMSSSILFPTNQYAVGSKSHEEIMKLTTPAGMNLEQYLGHIATKGLPPQFPFLYRNIHKAYKATLAFACSKAASESAENQIIIAQSLSHLLSLSPSELEPDEIQLVFTTALDCLNNLQSPSNQQLSKVIELTIVRHPFSKKLVLKLEEVALQLGRPPQPIISKVTSCRLISLLALYLNRTLKGEMIDILKRVLSDNEPEVRKVWVMEIFPKLLRNLDLEFVELHLQEKIYESVWDQNEEIAALALETILVNAAKFSPQEQSSRIVKLFIDSLTSKRQRLAVLSSELMGPAYQKLLHSVLSSESLCLRFWKSLIELSTSKNQTILNNLVYNLPGILSLTFPLHKIDSMCDVYVELLYHPQSNKIVLGGYFHEMAKMFPSKWGELKEVAYWMFGELTEQQHPCDQAMRILMKIVARLDQSKAVFLEAGDNEEFYFQLPFCEYLIHFYEMVQSTNNSRWLTQFHCSLSKCYENFPAQFVQSSLLPRLYQSSRNKPADPQLLTETLVKLTTRDSNPTLINTFTSKISVQLCKSSKSYERQTALLFLHYATYYCSIDMFQEYRLGEKYLSFSTDKNFKVKSTFIRHLPRLVYFLTRQERIEYAIIVSRIAKDTDYQIHTLMQSLDFTESEEERKVIEAGSKVLKQRQRQRMVVLNVRKQNINRRASKQLKKEEVLKKKIETTKSKTKILIKDMPKKKVGPVLVKTSSNFHLKKHS